jgi:hypothetical protein
VIDKSPGRGFFIGSYAAFIARLRVFSKLLDDYENLDQIWCEATVKRLSGAAQSGDKPCKRNALSHINVIGERRKRPLQVGTLLASYPLFNF